MTTARLTTHARRAHRRWRFYFLAGVATGTTLGVAIG